MRCALALARRGSGRTWPNPAVGCVLVREDLDPEQSARTGGRVVGRGWTQPGGRPHAETEALARAGDLARCATAYVTLEPCNHHGETGPCSEALVAAGVRRVVIALQDPDPRVSGGGVKRLKDAGLEVAVGLLADEAAAINAGFLKRMTVGRPLVTLKTATSLDGRIATGAGHSKWITGDGARARGHLMRARADAVLTGIATVLADDPDLTCRLPGMAAFSPVRVVMDSHLRLPLDSRLVTTANAGPVWAVCRRSAETVKRAKALSERGVKILTVEAGADNRPDPSAVLEEMAAAGITSVLLESGGELAGAFMKAALIDRIAWFRASSVIGGDGMAAVAGFGLESMEKAPRFTRRAVEEIGGDLLETLVVEQPSA